MKNVKKAIVTGAASGLGKALSLEFGRRGYFIVLIDIAEDKLHEVAQAVFDLGGEVMPLVLDLSDEVAVSQAFEKLNAEVSPIDMLFNCAGFSITSTCEQISPMDWQKIIQVNLLGTIQLSTLVFTQMKEQGFGRIVNIASMFGLFPAPSGIAYATTKHGIVGFTRTLAVEAKDFGISVHLVCPGFIQTNFFENAQYIGVEKKTMMGAVPTNLISAEEASAKILRGVSAGKRMIIFPFYVRILWWLDWFVPSLSERIWLGEMRKYRDMSR